MPDQIQTWIQQAKAKGASDEEIQSKLKPEDRAKYYPQSKPPQGGGFFSNMLSQLGSNVAAIPQEAKSVWNAFQRHPDPSSPTGTTGGLSSVMDTLIHGAGSGLRNQQEQAGQEIAGGHPLYGAMRSMVGGVVPGVGPATMDIIDQSFGKGQYEGQPDPGGATGNALTLGAQLLGPKAFKAATAPVRNAGMNLFEDALKLPKGQVNPSVPEILGMAKATGATTSKSSIEDLGDLVSTAQSNVKDDIIRRTLQQNPHISYADMMQPSISKYADYVRGGNEELPQAKQLLDRMDDFQQKFGNGVNLAQANEQKNLTWNLLTNKDFLTTENKTSGLVDALKLRGQGIKQSMEDASGGPGAPLAENNNIAHVALTLKHQLETISNEKRSLIARWAPRILAAGAGAGVHTMGGAYGNTMSIGGAIGAAGLAHYVTRLAMEDPAAMTKLGQFMGSIGEGPAGQVITNLPKIGLAQTPQGKVSTAPPAQPAPRVTPSAPPKNAKIDLPSEIQQASASEGLDPRLAAAVANQESGTRHYGDDGSVLQGPETRSGDHAHGVFQLMAATAKDLGVDRDNPRGNVKGGVKYLAQMMDRFDGDTRKALAAYNFGPDNVESGKPWPPETRNYVDSIMKSLGGNR